MSDESAAGGQDQGLESIVVCPKRKKRKKKKGDADRKPIPRYHVVLWNDDDHTFEYVIRMLKDLFGHPETLGFAMAQAVHLAGRCTVLTTTKEHAEFKRDQIHAYGPDPDVAECTGSMWATVEPADD
ncbi:MAG: ATP-dependent Clp protease adaptor ClpS [Planctomycetota bacterium]|nr:MAG: ATP-dependent Clp protease adaptor ClpS [Planctomycetota bacterium]